MYYQRPLLLSFFLPVQKAQQAVAKEPESQIASAPKNICRFVAATEKHTVTPARQNVRVLKTGLQAPANNFIKS